MNVPKDCQSLQLQAAQEWRVNSYGLGSGCHAEPRVGEGMRSDHKDRNELVKIEDRSNECEYPIPVNHQETIE